LKTTTELGAGDINRNFSGEFLFYVAKTHYLLYMAPKSKHVNFLKKHLTVQSTDWTIEVPEFESLPGMRIFYLHSVHTGTGAHPALYLTGTGGFSPELKRPGVRENNHSHPSTAKVKNAWCYTSTQKHVRGVIINTGTTLPLHIKIYNYPFQTFLYTANIKVMTGNVF
jgi:hypothetical protein